MKIERGIPVPEKTGKPLGYPWPKMRVGDSIVVRESTAGRYAFKALRSWLRWAERNGITDRKATSRSIGDGRVRIWVVAKEGTR